MKNNNILKIYIDETGDTNYGKGASEIFGISMVFHESKNNIDKELSNLNYVLKQVGFENQMVHTTVLINNKDNQYKMNVFERKKIINILFHFYSIANINSKSFFINKKEIKDKDTLQLRFTRELKQFVNNHLEYFLSFDKVIVYFDDGQIQLGRIIRKVFGLLSNFIQIKDFDKVNERLFQVADMITFFDKIIYKIKYNIIFNTIEIKFYSKKEIKAKIQDIKKKTFK